MKENPHIAKIAVFASGNGSNAENIIRYFNDPSSVHGGTAEVALVVCNRPEAPVLARAAALGVPAETITRAQLNDEAEFMRIMEKYGIDSIFSYHKVQWKDSQHTPFAPAPLRRQRHVWPSYT